MVKAERRERQIAHTREDILRAAATALARHGLEAVTIHDIAREAGYTTTSLYSYFEGKQDIIASLFARLSDEITATFRDRSYPPTSSFAERVAHLLRRQLEVVERWEPAFVVFSRVAIVSDPRARLRRTRRGLPDRARFTEALAEWIRGAAGPDDLHGRDPREVARVLEGISLSLFEQWQADPDAGALADWSDAILKWFVAGLGGFDAQQRSRSAVRALRTGRAGGKPA